MKMRVHLFILTRYHLIAKNKIIEIIIITIKSKVKRKKEKLFFFFPVLAMLS